MFSIFSGTEARRLPGASQFPWGEILLVAIVLIALAGIGYSVVSRESESTSATVVPVVEQPVAVELQDPPQNVQENVASAGPVVVDYQVVWTEVKDFDPFTIPVEEGFYNGRMAYAFDPHPSTRDYSASIPIKVWKILPHLEGLAVAIAADRDNNQDIVLVALQADRYGPSVLLSVDGEKSWCMLNLLPVGTIPANGGVIDVRVVQAGDTIRLYGQDSRVGYQWWQTTVVKKSELPCS